MGKLGDRRAASWEMHVITTQKEELREAMAEIEQMKLERTQMSGTLVDICEKYKVEIDEIGVGC